MYEGNDCDRKSMKSKETRQKVAELQDKANIDS